jgi:hypothetical protein
MTQEDNQQQNKPIDAEFEEVSPRYRREPDITEEDFAAFIVKNREAQTKWQSQSYLIT